MEELKPYMVKFDKDGVMKAKNYPNNCIVRDEKQRPIIIITHDECIFSTNNNVQKVWTWEGNTFLWIKRQSQRIITSYFLLLFSQLNLAFLSSENRKKVAEKYGLLETEAVEVFEYRKNNKGYWNGAKLHKQVVTKALLIREALYSGYSLLFIIDNVTSHSVYAKNAL